jgi:TolA-binding protein
MGWLAACGLGAVVCLGQGPVTERVQFADGLFSRGLYDMARQEYEALLARPEPPPDRDVLLFRLAECHRELGSKSDAERAYRALIEAFPESTYRHQAEFRRAELFVAAAQFAEAETLFRALAGRDPPEDILASSLYFLGYCMERQERGTEAQEAYREVVRRFPRSDYASYAALAAARLLRGQAGREAEADAYLAQAAAQSTTPRVAAEAQFLRGDVAYAAGDYTAAAAAYRELLSRYPDDRRAREARLQAAWSYFHAGQVGEAARLAAANLEAAASDTRPAWLYLQANCRRRQGDAARAVADYDALLRAYPEDALAGAAAYERLLVLFQQGDYAAVARDGPVLSAQPTYAEDLRWLLAESYIGLHRLPEAERILEALVAEHPDTDRAPVALFRLARMHYDRGAFEEAGRLYRQVADAYPEDRLAPEALAAAAYSETARGAYPPALADWTRLVADFPDWPRLEEALYQKALTELNLERPEAGETLRRLLARAPRGADAAEAHYWLGVLAERAGDPAGAEASLREALALEPSAELAARIRFRMAGALQGLERFPEAADILQELLGTAVRRDMSAPLLEWLARFRLEQQDYARAREAAEALGEDAPSPAWAQIGWTLAGNAARAQGDAAQATAAYLRAVAQPAQGPEGVGASLALGELMLDAGRLEEAASHFRRAAEHAADPDLARTRARCYLGLGDVARLQQDWEEAVRRYLSVSILFDDPELTPRALFGAVEGFTELGRRAERLSTAEELRRRYPDSPWTRKLQEEP